MTSSRVWGNSVKALLLSLTCRIREAFFAENFQKVVKCRAQPPPCCRWRKKAEFLRYEISLGPAANLPMRRVARPMRSFLSLEAYCLWSNKFKDRVFKVYARVGTAHRPKQITVLKPCFDPAPLVACQHRRRSSSCQQECLIICLESHRTYFYIDHDEGRRPQRALEACIAMIEMQW